MSFSEWEEFGTNPKRFGHYWIYRDREGMPAGQVHEQQGGFAAYGKSKRRIGKGYGPSFLGKFLTVDEAMSAVKAAAEKKGNQK